MITVILMLLFKQELKWSRTMKSAQLSVVLHTTSLIQMGLNLKLSTELCALFRMCRPRSDIILASY